MAKKAAAKSDQPVWMKPRLDGQKVCFAGRFEKYDWKFSRERLEKYVSSEGGTVVEKLDETVSYLLLKEPTGSTSHEKKVTQLNAKGASIAVIDPNQLRSMVEPSADLISEMIQYGKEGWGRLKGILSALNLSHRNGALVDLAKLSFRGQNLDDVPLWCANFEASDFSETIARPPEKHEYHYKFGKLSRCKLDKSQLPTNFDALVDCSCRDADFSGGWFGEYDEKNRCCSDFTKSKMQRFHFSVGADVSESVFAKCDLTSASFESCKVHNANFSSACLKSVEAKQGDFTGSDFSKADLSNTDLIETKFDNCNLSGAKLNGAIMTGASLKNAKLDGADFTGANVAGVDFTGTDISKAKGLSQEPAKKRTVGPQLKELSGLGKSAKNFRTAIEVRSGEQIIRLTVELTWNGYVASWSKDLWATTLTDWTTTTKSVADAMVAAVNCWPDATPQVHTVEASSKGAGVKTRQLIELARTAWCETYGIAVPDEAELNALLDQANAVSKSAKEAKLSTLDQPDGIEVWNSMNRIERESVNPVEKRDFTGKKLDAVEFNSIKFEDCRFDNASLAGAAFSFGGLKKCTLKNSDLSGVKANYVTFDGCDFSGTNLTKAYLECAKFRDADLSKANVDQAILRSADLRGANLSCFKGKTGWFGSGDPGPLDGAIFDEATIFPPKYVIPERMVWKGKGIDPRATAAIEMAKTTGPISLADFMTLLEASVEKERLKKATSMLKAERFRLFAQATDDLLIGIVKSQNDPDLVYSCRLTKEGEFSCCTQNLNVCGGLRGSLCKHLLVLIIGMIQGGELDATTVNQWIQATRFKKPLLDKDAMSETLLRYKGAEAGDVDWRPMETIPEDYYTL